MMKSLPCLSALAAIIVTGAAIAEPLPAVPDNSSQVPLNPPPGSQPDKIAVGDRLLMQASTQLERRASVSARLRHQVAIASQQLYGVGSYWQQGSGEDLKVRLELQIAGQDAQLLQVCNSRFVWVDRTLPTGRAISRIDLRQLRADPSLAASNLNDIKPGEANWSSLQSELTAYTGGLPTLLAALSQNFTFLPPQAMRLAIAPPLAPEPTNLPVFAVVGHWKPERLATLLSKTQTAAADNQPPAAGSKHDKLLPERMPEEVLLLVGQADLFPYRIEYRRLETPQIVGGDGATIPYQLSAHPMVVLELSEVVFDTPVAPAQFDYAPGNADWVDQTTVILQRLRQQHQAQVATRAAPNSAVPTRQ
jgi:hypothetical protein